MTTLFAVNTFNNCFIFVEMQATYFSLTLAGIDCLYNGYLAICGKELASAHLKDYAEMFVLSSKFLNFN